MKKVNLGSGGICLDDWINIDNSFNARLAKHPRLRYLLFKVGILPRKYYELPWAEHVKSIIVRDVRRKLPFDNESINFIYSSHFLEHLRKDEAEKVLRDCFRVLLQSNGIIRLSVPDLELLAKNYCSEVEDVRNSRGEEHRLPAEKFLDMLDMGEETKPSLLSKIFPSKHKWMYDELSLTALLSSCGFVDIEKSDYRMGKMPDINLLDNRPEKSLYLEARKP